MNTRPLVREDLEIVRRLHDKYYSEYRFPDFLHLLNGFVIEDENREIVLAGGVEPIAEAVLVTNQEKSRIKIGRALVEAQKIALFTCKHFGINELYAFTNNSEYEKHLVQHGFTILITTPLSMRIYGKE